MEQRLTSTVLESEGDPASLSFGFVGLGGMGALHASNLAEIGVSIAAGTDVSDPARKAFADEYDANTFEQAETMFDQSELDGVIIATPNAFHEPTAVAALEHDVNVLVEKPLADTVEKAESIADAADRSNAFCMVGLHNRFTGAADLFKHFQGEDRFGELSHIEANYLRRRGIPGLDSWFTSKELAGGGALIDIGVHVLDFVLYLAGSPAVEEVTGAVRTNFGHRTDYADPDNWSSNWSDSNGQFDVEDSATAFIRCENELTIALDVAWASNRTPKREIVVRGTEAGATMQLGGESIEINSAMAQPHDHYITSEYTGERTVVGHRAEVEFFVSSILEETAPSINTVDDGLKVQRVLDAIYRSSDEGKAISLH